MDHVISMYFSWTCTVDQNERRETTGDHVISMYFSWTCPVDQNENRETAGDHVIQGSRNRGVGGTQDQAPNIFSGGVNEGFTPPNNSGTNLQ